MRGIVLYMAVDATTYTVAHLGEETDPNVQVLPSKGRLSLQLLNLSKTYKTAKNIAIYSAFLSKAQQSISIACQHSKNDQFP